MLVISAIHSILAIFNPRPSVEITPGSIQPGTSVAMRWHINDRADRISQLNIVLKCLKVTSETQRSGGETKTRTVKTPLYEQELLQTESQLEIAQGTLQFTIPEDRPASRRGNTNGIQWKVAFNGDIGRWPDMKQEMGFTVYPEDRQ